MFVLNIVTQSRTGHWTTQERSDYMAKAPHESSPKAYRMWLIQENIAGKRGIYFYTNNDCKIITNDSKLYDDLYDFTFVKNICNVHFYEVGDIVLCDPSSRLT